jgi:hypothetical protein
LKVLSLSGVMKPVLLLGNNDWFSADNCDLFNSDISLFVFYILPISNPLEKPLEKAPLSTFGP